jgi:hypothetical protein
MMKVRIGPVARVTEGAILAWPGIGLDLHNPMVGIGRAGLEFAETAIFRNTAPVGSAGVSFQLTEVSPNTFSGELKGPEHRQIDLEGNEQGHVLRVSVPARFPLPKAPEVDICIVLKEPTLAIDFVARFSGDSVEECLQVIAKGIAMNARLVGERVSAAVHRNGGTGEVDLYITKPYLETGMAIVHFRETGSKKE